ncbi:phage shock protein PspD [Arsenophonus nasoniae]|nr:phage shock protein PspD [Arsenophonus nasoniae]WGM12367.1 phage shock protein PspD [Arsenophonus nasoniae]WGM17046.1 phage shock protein PspD [Arsenophonus nasoniae]
MAIHYAPAGIIGLMLKYISRKPLRWFMLIAMQPLLRLGIAKLVRNLLWEKYEKIAK